MTLFERGYEDSKIHNWATLPVDHARYIIDSYHKRAAKNVYLAGFVKGAEDALRGAAA